MSEKKYSKQHEWITVDGEEMSCLSSYPKRERM